MFYEMKVEGNTYTINSPKKYIKFGTFKPETVDKVFNFSWDMVFSGEGEHRKHRSGGSHERKNGEVFANVFQGKLAECALYNLLYKNKIQSSEPDFSIHPLGVWDDEDINVLGKSISIKSTKAFGNLLLLEEKDWNDSAIYIPNNKAYDYTFLIRMNPFCEDLLKKNKLLYSASANKEELYKIISKENWEYDVPGYVSKYGLIEVISNRHVIHKGDKLNGKTEMDATNYYIQAGDLKSIDKFIDEIQQ